MEKSFLSLKRGFFFIIEKKRGREGSQKKGKKNKKRGTKIVSGVFGWLAVKVEREVRLSFGKKGRVD